MAGYVISMGNIEENELKNNISKGVYGTILKIPAGKWTPAVEGTLADYYSMNPGDHIYFFRKRKLYGIGKLVGVGEHDCKLLNFKNADRPIINEVDRHNQIIENDSIRFICTFIPDPIFFMDGLDMDYVLQSNPNAFKMLRAFWKLSFVKIDDTEDQALFDILLKENEKSLTKNIDEVEFNPILHQKIQTLERTDYQLKPSNIFETAKDNTMFKREMGLEAAMISYLMENETIFGKWDYISHQVVASPFKPIEYMDKMDIFGYRKISGYSTISKYLVVELKRDKVNREVVNQIMKYVDWINQEYAHGDFDMIEAYIVAHDFDDEIIAYSREIGTRSFSKNKPAINKIWRRLRIFKYKIEDNQLVFKELK